jgi:hypothetical protein
MLGCAISGIGELDEEALLNASFSGEKQPAVQNRHPAADSLELRCGLIAS